MLRYAQNTYTYLICRINKNGDLAVRRTLSNALMRDPPRDYRAEVKKIHKNKSYIKKRVCDQTGGVDIANALAGQYSILYSIVIVIL